MPLDAHDAALMGILDDFHQAVKQLPEVPPHPAVVELSAPASSACAARPPVDDWERSAEELLQEEELAPKPTTMKAEKGKHKR